MADRWDVVLFGASGVTGREVARHLAARAPGFGLSWAAAGRDRSRVEAVLAEVGAAPDAVLEADTGRAESIDALAASARVLVDVVGPYARHGAVVYEACIRHGTTELDLAGELDWLVAMLRRHEEAAQAAGARIVPCCGFEVLPFDLAARFAAEQAFARYGEAVAEVDVALSTRVAAPLRRTTDALSGGTWASGLGVLRRGASRALRDPHALDPGCSTGGGGYGVAPRRHSGSGAWLAPMVPSPLLGPPVAHRTAALLRADGDRVFSSRYRYREGTAVRRGALGPLLAGSGSALQLALGALAGAPAPLRRAAAGALERLGPQPGEGPRPEDLDRWSYRLDVRATTEGGGAVDVVAEAAGHPGYRSSPALVAEAALLLADPSAALPARCGFLTPATALGTEHLDRFAAAGMVVTVS